ncbi:MAG: isoprenylcysteine carboxylmethyltransferase family protein [Deltaproteobacteria bacterium]|nr:isoprenylcysteine carboxylmethyltransferase family protein [Deltaproteobacteria bacterium]
MSGADVQLTDKGRDAVRRARMLFLPLRVLVVIGLASLPAGGLNAALGHERLRIFLAALAVMIALERTGITADPSARSRDRASKILLVVGSFLGFLIGVREVATGRPLLPALPLVDDGLVLAAGLVTWGAGLAVRQWAMRTLGRFFTDRVRIFTDHRLITEGPYRWVRHPSYAGLALVLAGAPLVLGSTLALVISVVAGGSALAFRVRVEEAALRAAFGDQYTRYAQRTPALLPWPRPDGAAPPPPAP